MTAKKLFEEKGKHGAYEELNKQMTDLEAKQKKAKTFDEQMKLEGERATLQTQLAALATY